MKRNNINEISPDRLKQHKACIAFHEAGHAAAIYLHNKAKHLPPVYFQIIFKEINNDKNYDVVSYQLSHDDSIARVEGGRLIQSLPYTLDGLTHKLCDYNDMINPQVSDYIMAFEADIIAPP